MGMGAGGVDVVEDDDDDVMGELTGQVSPLLISPMACPYALGINGDGYDDDNNNNGGGGGHYSDSPLRSSQEGSGRDAVSVMTDPMNTSSRSITTPTPIHLQQRSRVSSGGASMDHTPSTLPGSRANAASSSLIGRLIGSGKDLIGRLTGSGKYLTGNLTGSGKDLTGNLTGSGKDLTGRLTGSASSSFLEQTVERIELTVERIEHSIDKTIRGNSSTHQHTQIHYQYDFLSTHSINTSISQHPINASYQYILSQHPINTHYPRTLLPHSLFSSRHVDGLFP